MFFKAASKSAKRSVRFDHLLLYEDDSEAGYHLTTHDIPFCDTLDTIWRQRVRRAESWILGVIRVFVSDGFPMVRRDACHTLEGSRERAGVAIAQKF